VSLSGPLLNNPVHTFAVTDRSANRRGSRAVAMFGTHSLGFEPMWLALTERLRLAKRE
jgi:hypothetical protein